MEEGCSERVAVYVYDITQGMARSFSPMLLGRVIEGVWHTGEHAVYFVTACMLGARSAPLHDC